MSKLTYKQARKLVQERIDEVGPDFVYERPWVTEDDGTKYQLDSCVNYTINDQTGEREPSCIVGHVLHKIGKLNDQSVLDSNAVVDVQFHQEIFTEKAADYLGIIQYAQDAGVKYGKLNAEYEIKVMLSEEAV